MLTQILKDYFGGPTEATRAVGLPGKVIYEFGEKVPEKYHEAVRKAVKDRQKAQNARAKHLLG